MPDHIKPDNMLFWSGLISPAGDFFSCEFFEHNKRAFAIINENREKFKEILNDYPRPLNESNALDILINDGWCATRWLPTIHHYITYPGNGRLSTAQMETIWKANEKFGVNLNFSQEAERTWRYL